MKKKSIAIIPARGGSKGIPRKNLRPLAGKPMIFYSIKSCLDSKSISDVIVTTDDEEIALFAERFGAKVLIRDPSLADDKITLDPVIADAARQSEEILGYEVDIVITVQPTSPLIKPEDLDNCVAIFESKNEIDSVISVVDDRHLCWTKEDSGVVPAYEKRVNRQELKPNFRETGAIIACRRDVLMTGSRIGEKVELLIMPQERSFDIDNISDLYLCEGIIQRKRILFSVVGYPKVGLGHAFRAIMLANELVHHEIIFVCESKSQLAADYIAKHNYQVAICEDGKLTQSLISYSPDLVINDILDTDSKFINELKETIPTVVNFEDLGSGMLAADLVFNALYPNELPYEHVKVGHSYFCLRDEFIFTKPKEFCTEIEEVLITFGGVDEGNLTKRVVSLLSDLAERMKIKLTVVTGPGYQHKATLNEFEKKNHIELVNTTSRISDYMSRADVAITSGGRTVFELTAMKVPTIVICQNKRETTHTFASSGNGIVNLGYRSELSDKVIFERISKVLTEHKVRVAMKRRLEELDLVSGKQRVCELIQNLIK